MLKYTFQNIKNQQTCNMVKYVAFMRFTEDKKHLLSWQALNYFVVYICYWMKS